MQQVYADDKEALEYVRARWPHAADAYQSLVPGAFKADLWRLLVLFEFGGVYADLGFLFVAPLHDTLVDFDNDELVLVVDPPQHHADGTELEGLYQAFMAAYPRHAVVGAMIEAVLENVVAQEYGTGALDITGPIAVARVFRACVGRAFGRLRPGRFTFTNHLDDQDGESPLAMDGQVFKVALGRLITHDPHGKPLTPHNYIVGPTGVQALFTKFPNYAQVVYSNRLALHYSDLYARRSVFRRAHPVPFLTFSEFLTKWSLGKAGETAAGTTPRVLWRTGWFPAHALPGPVLDVMGSFTDLAPEWEQVYCTDEDQVYFLDTFYPAAGQAWRHLRPGAFKADVWRVFILLYFGGLYIDLPMRLLVPLATFFDPTRDDVLLARDRDGGTATRPLLRLYQAILGARPNHPLLRAMATKILANIHTQTYGEDCLDITGPTAVGRAALQFFGTPRALPKIGRSRVLSRGHGPVRVSMLNHIGNEKVLGLDNRTQVLHTKFPHTKQLFYPPGDKARAKSYGELWDEKQVFFP